MKKTAKKLIHYIVFITEYNGEYEYSTRYLYSSTLTDKQAIEHAVMQGWRTDGTYNKEEGRWWYADCIAASCDSIEAVPESHWKILNKYL